MIARLFFGIPFPDQHGRLLSDAAAQALAACRARVTPSRNIHVTVRFLGDLDTARIPALSDAVRRAVAEVPAFDLTMQRLVLGPPGGPPRMVWADFLPEPRFEELCVAVRRASDAAVPGIMDTHAPTPHATLARILVADCAPLVRLPERPPIAGVRVGECALFESRLAPGGPTYQRLETFPLAE